MSSYPTFTKSGVYRWTDQETGQPVAAFVDCGDIEERWLSSQQGLQEAQWKAEQVKRERTRQCMLELGMPDPDDEDRSYLVRIPGRKRIWNHPLLK